MLPTLVACVRSLVRSLARSRGYARVCRARAHARISVSCSAYTHAYIMCIAVHVTYFLRLLYERCRRKRLVRQLVDSRSRVDDSRGYRFFTSIV